MADPAPDFTYSLEQGQAPSAVSLKPLFNWLLTRRDKPVVSLGQVTRATANAWLIEMRDDYCVAIGKRSGLLQNLDMVNRVQMVDLTDE